MAFTYVLLHCPALCAHFVAKKKFGSLPYNREPSLEYTQENWEATWRPPLYLKPWNIMNLRPMKFSWSSIQATLGPPHYRPTVGFPRMEKSGWSNAEIPPLAGLPTQDKHVAWRTSCEDQWQMKCKRFAIQWTDIGKSMQKWKARKFPKMVAQGSSINCTGKKLFHIDPNLSQWVTISTCAHPPLTVNRPSLDCPTVSRCLIQLSLWWLSGR